MAAKKRSPRQTVAQAKAQRKAAKPMKQGGNKPAWMKEKES